MSIPRVSVADFDYDLPSSHIALAPVSVREKSKLLTYQQGSISDLHFQDVISQLPPGAHLLFNDAKVVQSRLRFVKPTGGEVEIFCLQPHNTSIELGLAAEGVTEWRCLVGGSKKWKEGAVTMLGAQLEVKAWRVEKTDEFEVIRFEWQGHPFSEVLRLAGKMPLPPYIDRDTTPDDSHRYQTVYARVEGSVAAPTAGLHFSESLLNQLDSTGMLRSSITLHVGAGTFKPMTGDTAGDHRMHEEYFTASRALIEHLAGESRPVIAVGTTSMRALESLYWLGVQVLSGGEPHRLGQWFPYENKSEISVKESLTALSEMMKANDSDSLTASTSIMIVPGYRVRMAKGLVTNFHLPKSTLLMLVAALIGKDWKKVYDHALSNNYRFLSYGDASLLLW